jgi:hypothetical protein
MARSIHDQIKDERNAAFPEVKDLIDMRAYYRGRQKGTHTPIQARMLRGVLGHLFCDNICRKVINEEASRHELIKFVVESEPVSAYLEDLVIKNHLAALQQDVGIAVLRDGNHALALRWLPDNPDRPSLGRVTIHRERWWDGTCGIFVAYGADGLPSYAVKDWTETVENGELERRIIWFADHFERWVADGDGWKPFPLASDPADSNGLVSWTKRDGSPLGIPVVHFANGSDNDSMYGASELDGGVLGLQDEINDVQRDITATARLTGYQMYWRTGDEPERDAAGNPKPLLVGPGQVLQSANENAKYGVLAAGDLGQIKGALMTKIEAVCRMTDTPLHVITGDWPSGTALLRSEMPLVAKVNRLNKTVGPSWATVAHRATEMANTFGEGAELDETALITVEWAPPERLDALTLATIAETEAKAQIAIELLTDEESLVAMGMTLEEARARLKRREDRADANLAALTGIAAAQSGGGAQATGPSGPTGPGA